MGHRIYPKPPTEYAADCLSCTPSPIPLGHTPNAIRAVFHDLIACPGFPEPPNDLPIHCYNTLAQPCLYKREITITGELWRLWHRIDTGYLNMWLVQASTRLAFAGGPVPCETGPFFNTTICPGNAATGGTAYVLDLPDDFIMELAETDNLLPDIDGRFEKQTSVQPGEWLARLAGKTIQGSILVIGHPTT